MATPIAVPRIQLLKSVSIANFRGFGKEKRLDTDAEIVLLTGANGLGKSSVVEALLLVLTGYTFRRRKNLVHLGNEGEDENQGKEFIISAEALTTHGAVNIEARGGVEESETTFTMNGEPARPRSVRDRIVIPNERGHDHVGELDARLCAFLPDLIDLAYDEGSSGATVREIFEEPEAALDALRERLQALKHRFEELRDRYPLLLYQEEEREQIRKRAAEFAGAVLDIYHEMRVYAQDWPELSGDTVTDRLGSLLQGWELSDRDAKRLVERLREKARELRSMFVDQRRLVELARQIELIDAEIGRRQTDAGKLRDEVEGFSGLEEAIYAIAERTPQWIAHAEALAAEGQGFEALLTELRAVQRKVAAARCYELSSWLNPRRKLLEELDSLEEKRGELERERDKLLEASTAQDWLVRLEPLVREESLGQWKQYAELLRGERETSAREAARQVMDGALEEVEAIQEAIEAVLEQESKLDDELRKRVDGIRGRFAFAGRAQLRLELSNRPDGDGKETKTFSVRTDDGRSRGHFSTGQRAQIAVALLVGQNELIRTVELPGESPSDGCALPHDVLLLDDVSTPYDLSNLTREAILWRQLAYASDNPRQLFICSHHEDMMNQQLDLLAPPIGQRRDKRRSFRMIVHHFKAWGMENGPQVDSYEVRPCGRLDATGIQQLNEALDRW